MGRSNPIQDPSSHSIVPHIIDIDVMPDEREAEPIFITRYQVVGYVR